VRHLRLHLPDEPIDVGWHVDGIVDPDVVLQRPRDDMAAIAPCIDGDGGVLWREHREIAVDQVDLERDRKRVATAVACVHGRGEIGRAHDGTRNLTQLDVALYPEPAIVLVFHLNDVLRACAGIRRRFIRRGRRGRIEGIVRVNRCRHAARG